jgi:hypothetical protein
MLRNHEPYGAVVVDRTWNVLLSNAPWRTVFGALSGVADGPVNLLRATFGPALRAHLLNWEEIARGTLERLRREATTEGDPELEALHDELLAMPGVPASLRHSGWDRPPPLVLPVRLRVGEQELSLFTTIATLGTPTDVTLSELRIEQYHPADAATDAWIRRAFGRPDPATAAGPPFANF